MQLSFIALYVNPESVFKSCFTSRGLGDKGCHLVESPLQYLEDKGFSTPLQHYYNFFLLGYNSKQCVCGRSCINTSFHLIIVNNYIISDDFFVVKILHA